MTNVVDTTLLEALQHEDEAVRKLAQMLLELLEKYEQKEGEEIETRLRRK